LHSVGPCRTIQISGFTRRSCTMRRASDRRERVSSPGAASARGRPRPQRVRPKKYETMKGMELDPFSHEFHEDPYPVYRELRDNAPCYRNEKVGFYALSRYQDVLEASQQPLLYSSA